MHRRKFITLVGSTAAIWPLATFAQQRAGRTYQVGYLSIASRDHTLDLINAFEEGMRDLGYRIGENVVIEYRFAKGEIEQLPVLAADLVRRSVDVIIVAGVTPVVVAAMKATTTIPIVTTVVVEPVRAGLVASLARPGGNVTGLTADTGDEIVGKRFELLKEALPNLSRVGVLWNPDVALNRNRLIPMGETARSLGLTIVPVEARKLDEVDQAFATMSKERVQGFIVQGDSVLYNYRGQIAEAALRTRLPGTAGQKEFADVGFLLTYGADLQDLWRRAATYVDKIFKGAKPADLPVEEPIKFELVINLKTAKQLGLVVPPTLLARADEVIE